MKLVAATIGLTLMFVGVVARGDAKSNEARVHFEAATSHYALGEFAEAAEEYQKAFRIKPDRALLYNAAQAFRLANNLEKALILYRNYVQLYPNEPNVDEVRGQVAKVREAIAAAERAKNAPPTEAKPMPAEPSESRPPAPTVVEPTVQAAPVDTAQKVERTPVYKKWWLWTVVGVVVVGAVVTGVVLATVPNGTWETDPTVGPGTMGLTVRF